MSKITFIGAGSTVFAKNVLGDCMLTPSLSESEIALYDIDAIRLKESNDMLEAMNKKINGGKAKIKSYCGVEKRKEAIKNSDFIVIAIQVGGYEPCTITDFEIPKKYGIRQTIADTLGIGGIFRTLRTLPVFEEIARDIEEYAPSSWLLNYVNPMAMITGFMLRYTGVKTVGLCHSVQVCSKELLENVGMEDKLEGRKDFIAGINHMAWLLDIRDKNGNDLYPEIKKRVESKTEKHKDMVRFEYIKKLGYYCTESSEHNAEYNPFFIKSKYPQLIDKFNIPLDEYPRRCIKQIEDWKKDSQNLLDGNFLDHKRSREYGSFIMNAILTNEPYKIGGNVLNKGLIENLVKDACVEVPCLVDGNGIQPTYVGSIPTQLAAMNMTNINPQLLTIEAHVTKKLEHIYHAAMLDPHTAAELSIDDIVSLCNELIESHGNWLPKYK